MAKGWHQYTGSLQATWPGFAPPQRDIHTGCALWTHVRLNIFWTSHSGSSPTPMLAYGSWQKSLKVLRKYRNENTYKVSSKVELQQCGMACFQQPTLPIKQRNKRTKHFYKKHLLNFLNTHKKPNNLPSVSKYSMSISLVR